MSELKEIFDDQETSVEVATRFKTERNTAALRCAGCSELFYVDEHTFSRTLSDLAFDPADSPFYCGDCEAEYAEEER